MTQLPLPFREPDPPKRKLPPQPPLRVAGLFAALAVSKQDCTRRVTARLYFVRSNPHPRPRYSTNDSQACSSTSTFRV